MTNADFPRGFQATDDKGTEIVNLKASVASDNATPLGQGDLISIKADGNIRRSNNTDSKEIIGVCNQFLSSDGQILLLLPTTTAGTALYVPVFSNRFVLQTSGTEVITAAAIGGLANILVSGDADTTTGQSKMEIDSSTLTQGIAVPGTGIQLVIEGKSDRSEWDLPNVELIVTVNTYQGNTGTVAI